MLFNTWKHHAAALRRQIRATVPAGAAGLETLAGKLVVVGEGLMDLYLGPLTPAEIGARLLERLRAEQLLSPAAYQDWLTARGGYFTWMLAGDASRWVLRLGDKSDRYVHVHPARRAPQTCRVRANVLKTAVLVLAYSGVHGGDPCDAALIGEVRRVYLGLPPVGRALAGAEGLGKVIALLLGS